MQNRMPARPRRLTRILAAVSAAALPLLSLTATPPAQAKGSTCEPHHVRRHASNGAGHYSTTLWVRGCVRARPGHDLMWVKPTNGAAGYQTTHYVFHPTLYCTPVGDLSFYVFRLYVWNPTTGYNHHQAIRVDCEPDGGNSVMRGLIHWPRCYMPWVVDSEGRGGASGHRSHCYFRSTVERVYFGPDPNGFDDIAGRLRIEAFADVNR